jgi:hypothetical protein
MQLHTEILIDDLALSVRPHIGRLHADEALTLAAKLARGAFRRIASEEGAGTMIEFDDNEDGGQ